MEHPPRVTQTHTGIRDGGAYFQVGGGGLENQHWRRDFGEGSGGIIPQKIFKSRGSEMVFITFSMMVYFF